MRLTVILSGCPSHFLNSVPIVLIIFLFLFSFMLPIYMPFQGTVIFTICVAELALDQRSVEVTIQYMFLDPVRHAVLIQACLSGPHTIVLLY